MLPGEKVCLSGIESEVMERELSEAMDGLDEKSLREICEDSMRDFKPGAVVKGKVIEVTKDDVVVDIGYKCEGFISATEFDGRMETGQEVEVLLEAVESESGLIVLSKKKADRARTWERVIRSCSVGDTVRGRAVRKTKGGLLVDIGVFVFLPASQVDIRRVGDVSEYIGREIEGRIIKIDEDRRNIVISRRKLLEEEREKMKIQLFEELERGQIRRGVIKNITDFGAFIDLGGIDGLLHVTDLSWARVGHPSEIVSSGQTIEVKVLDFDPERERISLGLKQLTPNPWANIEEKFPVASRVKGEIVNIMPYGAFVRLEPGIEGLVHISEMSWTRQIGHPQEVVKVGDVVEVVVLEINPKKHEVSLGMKQVEEDPWVHVEAKFPVGTHVKGRVRNLTSYGAFVELDENIDGLLHISDMSWTKKVPHPSAVLKKGEELEAIVIAVDQNRKRLALSVKHLHEDPWNAEIPAKFHAGQILEGTITKLTSFGAFVEIDKDLEGLLHISEMADHKIDKPEEVAHAGDTVKVKILNVDPHERKIGLSMKAVGKEEETGPVETDATDYSRYLAQGPSRGSSLSVALDGILTQAGDREADAGEESGASSAPERPAVSPLASPAELAPVSPVESPPASLVIETVPTGEVSVPAGEEIGASSAPERPAVPPTDPVAEAVPVAEESAPVAEAVPVEEEPAPAAEEPAPAAPPPPEGDEKPS